MGPKAWNRAMGFIAVLLGAYIVVAAYGYIRDRAACDAKGGVAIKQYGSGILCVKGIEVIDTRSKP